MHPAARRAAADLAKAGVALDAVDDFHHLVRLDELARAAAAVRDDWKTRAVMFPALGIGGSTLRRLSIGARMFMQEQAATWISVGSNEWTVAVAFAMSHSHRPRALWKFLGNREAFLEATVAWAQGCGATFEALAEAVAKLSDEGPAPALPAPTTSEPPDYGEIAEVLAREYGRTPEYWFWEATEVEFALVLEKRNARVDRENKSIAAAGGQVVAPDPDSQWIRARVELRRYMEQIVTEKRAGQSASPPVGGKSGPAGPATTPPPGRTRGAS